MLSLIIGYFIFINIASMILIYIDIRFNLKIKEKNLNYIYIVITLFAGGIGIIIASKMFGYRRDSKVFRRLISLLVIIEVIIAVALVAKYNEWEIIDWDEFF